MDTSKGNALQDEQGRPPILDESSVGALAGAGLASPDLARMLDPEITAFIARTESFYPASINQTTAAENRATYDRMCAAFRSPRPAGISVNDSVLTAAGPERGLGLRHYGVPAAPPGITLLYLHGGGYVVGGLDSHDDVCAELCAGAGVAVTAGSVKNLGQVACRRWSDRPG